MERQEFLYFLFNEKGLPYYKAANGQILVGNGDYKKPDGQPASLSHAPVSWQDSTIKFIRNEKYYGLFRSMATSMNFPKDGAEILRNRYHNGKSYEEIVKLAIMRMDRLNLPYSYINWYLGEINYSKFRETATGVTVEAIDGGLAKEFKAKESVKYEIPVGDNPNFVWVLMDGKEFNFERTYAIVDAQEIATVPNYYLGMVELAIEGQAPDVLFFNVFPKQSTLYPNEDYFMRSDIVQEVQIVGNIDMHFVDTSTFQLRVEVDNGITGGTGGFPQYVLVNTAGSPRTAGTDENFTFDETFTIPAGNRCHMKIFGGTQIVKGGDIKIKYKYKYEATYIKGIYLWDLAEALVLKMTDNKYGIKSNWLANKKDLLYTSGDNIRGIEFDDTDPDNIIKEPVIRISFAELFSSLIFAGVGQENNELVIEQLDYFFDDSEVIIDLGVVKDAELSTAEDIGFNTIKAGYEKQDYEDVNGKYEVNQGQEWSTPVKNIIEVLDLVSKVRADSLGIELTRLKFTDRITTDSDGDGNPFMINVDEEIFNNGTIDYVKLHRPTYSNVNNLPNWETSFNTELRPRNRITGEGRKIASILDQLNNEEIKFASADKNSNLETTLNGINIVENGNIQIGTIGEKLFQLKFINFTTKIPLNLLELMQVNPYGKIKFEWNDRVWYGYVWEADFKPATNETQTWKLISAPQNNLSLFNKF
jgi:hypothetical protein